MTLSGKSIGNNPHQQKNPNHPMAHGVGGDTVDQREKIIQKSLFASLGPSWSGGRLTMFRILKGYQ